MRTGVPLKTLDLLNPEHECIIIIQPKLIRQYSTQTEACPSQQLKTWTVIALHIKDNFTSAWGSVSVVITICQLKQ